MEPPATAKFSPFPRLFSLSAEWYNRRVNAAESVPLCHEWRRDSYLISTDPQKLDFGVIREFLARSYWSPGIPRETVERGAKNSLCFGVYEEGRQVGFARAITDRATFAYLADVFILEAYRGRGLSKWLMECVKAHPELRGLRRWMLATKDAHALYAKFGFAPLTDMVKYMAINDPDVYRRSIP